MKLPGQRKAVNSMAGKKYEHLVLNEVLHQHSIPTAMYSPFLSGTQHFWKLVPRGRAFAFYYVKDRHVCGRPAYP